VRSKIAMKLTTVSAALTTSKGTKARHRSIPKSMAEIHQSCRKIQTVFTPHKRCARWMIKHSKRHHDRQNLNAASYFKLQHHAVQSKLERCQVPRP
jgi:hypothetical protein